MSADVLLYRPAINDVVATDKERVINVWLPFAHGDEAELHIFEVYPFPDLFKIVEVQFNYKLHVENAPADRTQVAVDFNMDRGIYAIKRTTPDVAGLLVQVRLLVVTGQWPTRKSIQTVF